MTLKGYSVLNLTVLYLSEYTDLLLSCVSLKHIPFHCLLADDSSAVKTNTIPAIKMPQLPPEPTGRCSNKLQV